MNISERAMDRRRSAAAGWQRLGEAALAAVARLWHGFGHSGPRGPEDGPPALVIPGFIASDRTTMELRRALAAAGWRVHPWGMRLEPGRHAPTRSSGSKARLDAIGPDEPVLVVGWSLGGLFARELARAHPDQVRAVVTLGSPFSGDPAPEQCLAALRMGRRAHGRRAADPARSPTSRRCRRWRSGRARDGIVAAARRARTGATKATRRSSSTATTWRSACRGGRPTQVVREIDSFLKTHDLIRRNSCFGNEKTPFSAA